MIQINPTRGLRNVLRAGGWREQPETEPGETDPTAPGVSPVEADRDLEALVDQLVDVRVRTLIDEIEGTRRA